MVNYELADQMGVRAMITITNGGDVGSAYNMMDAISTEVSEHVMIYSFYYASGDTHEIRARSRSFRRLAAAVSSKSASKRT
jgi:hypothetical protein